MNTTPRQLITIVAEAVVDLLAAKYFGTYAVIALLTPAGVARPDRF
jgi:hypothetical protein